MGFLAREKALRLAARDGDLAEVSRLVALHADKLGEARQACAAAEAAFNKLRLAALDKALVRREQAGLKALKRARDRLARQARQEIPGAMNVSAGDEGGTTALHHACRQGHGAVVRFLLSARGGADADAADAGGATPLHVGVRAGKFHGAVRPLLEHSMHARPLGPSFCCNFCTRQASIASIIFYAAAPVLCISFRASPHQESRRTRR